MANTTDSFDRQILDLVNSERVKAGANPLTLNEELDKAADAHTLDQAKTNKMSHTGSNGSNLGDRITDTGYIFSSTGENVAAGYKDATKVMEGWMNSPGHRENILNPDFKELGVGYAISEDGTPYWTEDFGTLMSAIVAAKPMSAPGPAKPTDKPMTADPLGNLTVGDPKELQPSQNPASTSVATNVMGIKISGAPTNSNVFEDMMKTPISGINVKSFQASTDLFGTPVNPLGIPVSTLPICDMG